MPLARDLSDLPRPSRSREDGWPPDATSRFGRALVDHWHEEGVERDKHFRDGQTARFFHSHAAKCSRAVAFAALGVPESNPMDLPGHFITTQGRLIHEAWQAILPKYWPGAAIEVEVRDGDRAGHIDALVEIPVGNRFEPDGGESVQMSVVAVEGKTVDGYAYKQAVGEKGPAQGPKNDHVVQAAINGRGVNADEVVIVYWTRGAVSVQAARRAKIDEVGRVTAEWTLPRETYEPIADLEIARIEAIFGLLDSGVLAARKIPDPELPTGHIITDPASGTWRLFDDTGGLVDVGTTWHCLYCRWQTTCSSTDAARQPVETLVEIGVLEPKEGAQ